MAEHLRVLLVKEGALDERRVRARLGDGAEMVVVHDPADAANARGFDAVLVLAPGAALTVLGGMRGAVPVIAIGEASAEDGAEAAGAAEFVAEDALEPRTLRRAIRWARSAEARLQEVIDGAPLFLAITRGPEHVVMLANQAYQRLVGRTDLIGRPVSRAVPPAEQKGWAAILDGVFRTGEPLVAPEFQATLDLPEGVRELTLSLEIRAIRGRGGSITGLAIHGVDVTEQVESRRRAERIAAEHESVLRQSTQGVVVADATGTITFVNDAAGRMFGGGSAGGLLGARGACRDLVSLDGAPIPEDQLPLTRALRENRTIRDMRLVLRHPEGTQTIIEASAGPIHSESGEKLGAVAMLKDVTHRLRLERHYARLVSAAPYGIYALDPEGRFTEVNPAGESILERPAASMLGRPFLEVVVPEDAGTAEDAFAAVMSGGSDTLEVELGVLRGSGVVRRVRVVAMPMREGRSIIGIHAIARDVTEERLRDAHLRRAERLASVGTLLGGVAHELNNPLAAIKGFVELMLMDERSSDDREALETMKREADRAAKIVADLRLIARETQDEPAGTRQPLDLNGIVGQVLRLREYTLRTRNIELREDLAPQLPPVLADGGQIEQVLLNLLVNAEQALSANPDGRILIVRSRPSRLGACITVVDNGPGIEPANLDRIFDPFFTTKPPGEGTGLGLSLVHSIVAEHGGQIRVESTPGRGAAFTLELPRAPITARAPVHPETSPVADGGLHVLIVDDEAPVRRTLARYLSRRGHRVAEACEGGEALRALEGAEPFDVVLSDLRMPGLGGDELYAALRRRGRGEERKLIFVTGDASGDALRLAAESHLPVVLKPFELPAVEALIRERGRLASRGS